ncbi:hypothetical protein SPFL3102_02726 [Sporomusaceae bacterium FL31]|nr:hypothetical protein SPFL3101_01056 [Sporomusaceae bacterium FL31]GCE34898.1 hypothetical protein SPFL3102_02726 [Sporomusaceae bacterium]
MKNLIISLAFICVLAFHGGVSYAEPAPNLSKVEITHVGADHTGWIPVNQISKKTLYGENFYVAVRFTGYPKSNRIFFYQNKNLVPVSQVKEAFDRKGIGNPHTGWVYHFAMPIAYGNGIITVQADGINGGTQYSTIFGVRSETQPAKQGQ